MAPHRRPGQIWEDKDPHPALHGRLIRIERIDGKWAYCTRLDGRMRPKYPGEVGTMKIATASLTNRRWTYIKG